MIEVNRCIGEPLEVMREMVEFQKLRHPVLWDRECQNNQAYGITMWPFAYLIGPDGRVFWEGNPAQWLRREKRNQQLRQLVEQKLEEAQRARLPQSTSK